jgi:hypothetical protein
VTPVQELLQTLDNLANNANGNLNNLAQQIETALGLPNGSVTFSYDPANENFLMRFQYQVQTQVRIVTTCRGSPPPFP